jgi:hypothetical protein
MSNRNPVAKFKKGQKPGSGRQPGQPNYLTVPMPRRRCDKGVPTGKFEEMVGIIARSITSGSIPPRPQSGAGVIEAWIHDTLGGLGLQVHFERDDAAVQ